MGPRAPLGLPSTAGASHSRVKEVRAGRRPRKGLGKSRSLGFRGFGGLVLGFKLQGCASSCFRVRCFSTLGIQAFCRLEFRTSGCLRWRAPRRIGSTQRAQYPLIKEYTLNHNMKAPIIKAYSLMRGIGSRGSIGSNYDGKVMPEALGMACAAFYGVQGSGFRVCGLGTGLGLGYRDIS